MSSAFCNLCMILIVLIFVASCVRIFCGGGRSNEDNEETGDFTNMVRFIKNYLEQLLISSPEISNVDELLYAPRRQELMSDQCYHSTYQEDPPPYDRAIQESAPYSESSTERKGSPPPEYYSLM